ncbi:Phenylacetate-coenzyme A ligase [bioreactor metagenome]|uniref:Phenylacetate-coenzyme A ligase n=2 Tax=root TaxID=1 RepID=A0A645EWV5_9ZZZZ
MLIIRGVNVFPSQVEAALASVKGLSLHYHLEVRHHKDMPELTVVCESAKLLSESGREQLKAKTSHHLKEKLGIRINVQIADPETLVRNEGKACRVMHVA